MREQCEVVNRDVCTTVPRDVCRSVPREECFTIPKEVCQTVPERVCEEKCIDVYWCKVCTESEAGSKSEASDLLRGAEAPPDTYLPPS